MNKIIYLIFLLQFSILNAQNNKLIASCCNNEEARRCTGSSNCTACTNCSGCKYCNSGGSCGICSGASVIKSNYSYNTYYSNRNIKNNYSSPKSAKKKSFYLKDNTTSNLYLKTLYITNTKINLRSGPGTNYEVIKVLYQYDQAYYLNQISDWIKVQEKETLLVGYVHKNYISF